MSIPRSRSSSESESEEEHNNNYHTPTRALSRSANSFTQHKDHSNHNRARSYEEEDNISSRLMSVCISPSELIGPFVGSFQESILSGHMSNTPATTYPGFMADLVVSGGGVSLPPHVKIPFSAVYYHLDIDTPYVGTIELDKKGYKIPQKGMIQVCYDTHLWTCCHRDVLRVKFVRICSECD